MQHHVSIDCPAELLIGLHARSHAIPVTSVYVVDAVVDECSHGGIISVPDLSRLDWTKVAPSHYEVKATTRTITDEMACDTD